MVILLLFFYGQFPIESFLTCALHSTFISSLILIEMYLLSHLFYRQGIMNAQHPQGSSSPILAPQNTPTCDTSSDVSPHLNPSPGFCTKCPLPHAPYCAYDGSAHRFCVYCGHFSVSLDHTCRYIAIQQHQERLDQLRKRIRPPTPSPSPAPPDGVHANVRAGSSPCLGCLPSSEENAYAHLEKD